MTDIREQKFHEMTVRIDRDTCIGSGNCVKVAPEVFELDDEQITSFRPDAEAPDRERLLEAIRVCPVYALQAMNSQGEQEAP